MNIRHKLSWHCWLQPFSHDYDLASHITYIGCVKFIYERQNLQFKFNSECQIFKNLFMAILFHSQNFWPKSTPRKLPKKYLFIFRFCCRHLSWHLNRDLTSNKPTSYYYLLDYGDFCPETIHKPKKAIGVTCAKSSYEKKFNLCSRNPIEVVVGSNLWLRYLEQNMKKYFFLSDFLSAVFWQKIQSKKEFLISIVRSRRSHVRN